MSNIFDIDWFKRSADYTRANTSMKLGWDSDLTGKYSSFLYSAARANMLINNNNALAEELRTLVEAMNIKNCSSIVINKNSDTSMTDGNEIIISTKFDTAVGDNFDTLDLIIGLLCHEAAHCLYTDFNLMRSELAKNNTNQLVHWIHNVLEDELIETKLGFKYPGYINFIAQIKYYYFDKCCASIIDESCKNDLDEITKLLLYVIRYPKYVSRVDKAILNKYDGLFNDIRQILINNSCIGVQFNNAITRLTLTSAKQIYELIKKYIEENNKENNEEKNAGQSTSNNKNDDNENSSTDGTDGDGGNGSDNSDSNNNEDNVNQSDDNGGDEDSDTPNDLPTQSDKKSFEEQESEIFNDDDSVINKTKEAITKCSSSSESSKPRMYRKTMSEQKIDNKTETHVIGSSPLTSVGEKDIVTQDITAYNKIANSIYKYIEQAKKIFMLNTSAKDVLECQRFRRNGTLDTNKLADAMIGINHVYKRSELVKKNNSPKFALVLMLDESGSMTAYTSNGNTYHYTTSQLSIMMIEALKSLSDIELYVYGHGDFVTKYMTKRNRNKYCVASRKIQMEQNEEISYRMIIDDVRSQTALPIVAINITDSMYLGNPTVVRDIIAEYASSKVSVNCICLGSYGASSEQMNNEIYGEGNWIAIPKLDEGFNQHINEFAKIIKRNYEKNK